MSLNKSVGILEKIINNSHLLESLRRIYNLYKESNIQFFSFLDFIDDENNEVINPSPASPQETHETNKKEKKLTICQFNRENSHMKFVDIKLNTKGNYNNYIIDCITTSKKIEEIDFSEEISKRKIILHPTDKKYTLILDLDETMIHSDFKNECSEIDQELSFLYEDEYITFGVNFRPGLLEFLNFIKEKFEVIVFTAAEREYADCILDFLDPDKNIFSQRLYRDSCISILEKVHIKDLRIIENRNLEQIILVDNSFYSFVNQISCGVLVTSYFEGKTDHELNDLIKYLSLIEQSNESTISVNARFFNFEGIKAQLNERED